MKAIIFLVILVFSTYAKAQTAVATANGNTATAKAHYSSNSKSTKTSVSVSDSDGSYTLRAEFDSWKRAKLQKLLSDNLDKNFLIVRDDIMIWKKENGNETAYTFALSNEKLKVNIDKELISKSTFEKFKALGEKISNLLTEK
jgi:hypothetical protein